MAEALPTTRRPGDPGSRRADNLIAGEWVPAVTGRTYERRNPAEPSDLLGHFPDSGRADVAAAAEAARSAFAAWSARRGAERATVFAAAAELAHERADEIAIVGVGPHEQGRAAIEFYTDVATIYLDA